MSYKKSNLKVRRRSSSRPFLGKPKGFSGLVKLLLALGLIIFLILRSGAMSRERGNRAQAVRSSPPRHAQAVSVPARSFPSLPPSSEKWKVSPMPTSREIYPDPYLSRISKDLPFQQPRYYFPASYPSFKRWRLSGRPWTSKPKIVFVLDDFGYKLSNEFALRQLGTKVTYAILPRLPYSERVDHIGRETGAEIILHLPLESEIGKKPGPGLIQRSMADDEIEDMLSGDLATVPNFMGSNNHMGSLGSQDRRVMRIILTALIRRGAFFLDSHTTPNFVSTQLAPSIGIPVLTRDVFLDNVDEREPIREQVRLTEKMSREKGVAIAIGHDRANTMAVLLEEIPRLEKAGFQIVSLGDLIEHRTGPK